MQLGVRKPQTTCHVLLDYSPAESPSLSRSKMLSALGKPFGAQPGGMSMREEQFVRWEMHKATPFHPGSLCPSFAGCWFYPPRQALPPSPRVWELVSSSDPQGLPESKPEGNVTHGFCGKSSLHLTPVYGRRWAVHVYMSAGSNLWGKY